jgi:hypothetical protein
MADMSPVRHLAHPHAAAQKFYQLGETFILSIFALFPQKQLGISGEKLLKPWLNITLKNMVSIPKH